MKLKYEGVSPRRFRVVTVRRWLALESFIRLKFGGGYSPRKLREVKVRRWLAPEGFVRLKYGGG